MILRYITLLANTNNIPDIGVTPFNSRPIHVKKTVVTWVAPD